MGWAQAAISIFSPLSNFPRTQAALSPQSPSRLTRRKNTLRPKILKTIHKPVQPNPISLPEQSLFEPAQPHEEDLQDLDTSICTPTDLVSEDEKTVLSVHASSALAEMNHVVSDTLSSRSVFQLALTFVGIFIFQTVCAVWVYGSLDKKKGNREEEADGSSYLGSKMEKRSSFDSFLLNKNGFSSGKVSCPELGQAPSLDESELEERISKIKIMAKEVRASEQMKLVGEKSNLLSSLVGEDNDGTGLPSKSDSSVSDLKTQIQKQVKRRLNKLQKRKAPKSSVDNYSMGYVKGLSKLVDMKDSMILSDKGNVAKSNSSTPKSNSMGFGGSRANSKIDLNINGNVGDNADNETKQNQASLRNEKNVKAMNDLKQNRLQGLPVSNSNMPGSLAIDEDESYCLRDEVFKQVALKVLANEQAGREPFTGLYSKDEINFFRALERKFKREGESAMSWVEMRVKNIDIDSSELKQTSQESPCEGRQSSVSRIIPDSTKKVINAEAQNFLPSEESSNMNTLLSRETVSPFSSQGKMERLESGRRTSISSSESGSQIYPGTTNSTEGSHMRITARELEPQLSQCFTKEHKETSTISRKQAISVNNGTSNPTLQISEVGKKSMHNKVNDRSSWIENESLWWRNLPYILVIVLSRGSDNKHPKGLYSLKMHHSDDETFPCTIAFEDRRDATNFCYLLESFFEDLGDFGADVVPLSIKELQRAVKSDDAKKVTVVRKGQLQLYAGKPLGEVEMDLRSIWNQTNC